MRPKVHIHLCFASFAALMLGTSHRASAAPSIAPPTDPERPAASGRPSDPARDASLDESSLHAHYRERPWAEELTLELAPGKSPVRRTVARIACDPSRPNNPADTSRPALRLELDTLTLVVTPSRFLAINASAPGVAFEAALSPSRPLLDQLRELVPALPFPQLFLALEPDHERAWAAAIAAIAPNAPRQLEVAPAAPDAPGLVALRTKSTPAAPDEPDRSTVQFRAAYLPDRGAFVELSARDTFGTMPGTLRITCKPLDPPTANAFTLDLADRQRVDSLARLRPPEPEIKPGMRLPTLGLVDESLALWSPQAAFDAQRGPTRVPLRLALVFYEAADEGGPNDPSHVEQAFDACLLARGLADKYRRDALNAPAHPEDADHLPRVGVVPVAVFDIAAFGPNAVRQEAIAWSELGTPGAFTSAGPALLKRFNPTGGVSIVIIDEDQIVRGVVNWNGRTSAQRRDDLDAALRGLDAKRAASEAPAPPATTPATTPP